ncbi:MAG: tetratricopeptide repeat protein [Chloroflexi bacterium]|nr:tetratricopeptide repeat protein [Chloroflexota bacterium]
MLASALASVARRSGVEVDQRKQQAWRAFRQGYEAQRQGCLEEAVRFYRLSIALRPTAEAHTFLGWSYSKQQRLHEAIRECVKAIRVDPDYGNPYNDIGAYLIELGRLDDAVPWLEKATRAKRYESPCFPWVNLGRVWERKARWYRAMECYKRALACNPRSAPAARALARIRGLLN